MRIFFTFLFSLLILNAEGQFYKVVSFDDSSYKSCVVIDSTTYHHNSWEVAKPHKTIFNAASSVPNAILTDRLNPYPVNDTSVFIFKYQTKGYKSNTLFEFSFVYQLDKDTNEIAKVEVSGDTGHTWIDMLQEDTTYDFQWANNHKPDFRKNTTNWDELRVIMTDWVVRDTGYPNIFSGKIMLFRFTFISDSIQTNKEGWIIDNLFVGEAFESINKISNPNLISLYPNPSEGSFFIKQETTNYSKASATIYNLQGQVVLQTNTIPPNGLINTSLPDGTYLLKYSTDKEYAVKRVTVQR